MLELISNQCLTLPTICHKSEKHNESEIEHEQPTKGEFVMNDTKKTLRDKIVAEKVVAVMQEVKSIQKKGKNTYAKYDYATADDVFDAVRPIMAKHGLSIKYKIKKERTCTHRKVEFLILPVKMKFAGESGYVTHPVPLNTSGGSGVRLDAQMLQAAITYAEKYFLRARLLLAVGGIDLDEAAPKAEAAPAKKQTRKKAAPKQPPQEDRRDDIKVDNDFGVMQVNGVNLKDVEPDRETAVALWKYVEGIIRFEETDDAEALIEANFTEIVRIIPAGGLVQLAKAMDAKGIGKDLPDRFAKAGDKA